jgi:hypothetical protein
MTEHLTLPNHTTPWLNQTHQQTIEAPCCPNYSIPQEAMTEHITWPNDYTAADDWTYRLKSMQQLLMTGHIT